MPKLPTINNTYIPQDVEFQNASGKMIPNSEFPKNEQVKTELTYADVEQKQMYLKTYSETKGKKNDPIKIITEMAYNPVLKNHVIKIENLFDEKNKAIKNGYDLMGCKHPGINDLKQDLFFRICGIRVDEEEDDGPGELNKGEN